MKNLFSEKDYKAIKQTLLENPNLANEGIPFDEDNQAKAPPLHRICDGVFAGTYSDEDAVEMAKIFLAYGAKIDGNEMIEKEDTPLIAAASLNAEKVGILYVDSGANVFHAGCNGGTALHWAAWCGKDKLVIRLIEAGAEINKQCIDYKATTLFWTIRGFKHRGEKHLQNYRECVKLLIEAGADKSIPNRAGNTVNELLVDDDLGFGL